LEVRGSFLFFSLFSLWGVNFRKISYQDEREGSDFGRIRDNFLD